MKGTSTHLGFAGTATSDFECQVEGFAEGQAFGRDAQRDLVLAVRVALLVAGRFECFTAGQRIRHSKEELQKRHVSNHKVVCCLFSRRLQYMYTCTSTLLVQCFCNCICKVQVQVFVINNHLCVVFDIGALAAFLRGARRLILAPGVELEAELFHGHRAVIVREDLHVRRALERLHQKRTEDGGYVEETGGNSSNQ